MVAAGRPVKPSVSESPMSMLQRPENVPKPDEGTDPLTTFPSTVTFFV